MTYFIPPDLQELVSRKNFKMSVPNQTFNVDVSGGVLMNLWPDHETSTDLLGFSYIADAVTNLASANHLLPATIGVFGDWGSGKSSLISMVRKKLEENEGTLVLDFNGWLFEGYDDVKSALMGTIIDEILNCKTPGRTAKTLAVNLLRRVNWFRVAGTALRYSAKYGAALFTGGPVGLGIAAGLDAKQALEKASVILTDIKEEELNKLLESETAHNLRRGIREFRKDFEALLKESNIDKLVVIIDDLDRCLPDTIIETLEAIKLFLFVPRTAFIIGADERLVEYAVKQRFPEFQGNKSEVGKDYLEKLIQYPIRIPPLGRAEMETYISLLFTEASGLDEELVTKARTKALERIGTDLELSFGIEEAQEVIGELPEELRESLGISARIAPLLARGLNGNPRQCKRFLNTFILRLEMAKLRGITLEQRILVKLMLLERFRPESFKQLARWQAAQGGRPQQLRNAELVIETEREHYKLSVKAGDKGDYSEAEKGEAKKEPEKFLQQIELDTDMQSWLSDPVIKEWIEFEPKLRDVDLRPYFFFSRDLLGAISGSAHRMSRPAQEMLGKLFNESEAVRNTALKDAAQLSEMDAATVLEGLGSRVRQEEDYGVETSAFQRLFDWGKVRPELLGQIITILSGLPEDNLPMFTPLRLVNVCSGTQSEPAAWQLISRWADSSTNALLKKAALNALKKKK